LIEVIGAFFMMTVILVFITGIFVENGRQRNAATELMRERLAAVGALDLIVGDLESAIFIVRPENADPDEHPWRVIAEGNGEFGATAMRFVTQNAQAGNQAEHASGWVEVAYFIEPDEEGQNVLWRWRSNRPPGQMPRSIPDSNDPASMRIAVGVSEFGVRFLDYEGEWVDEWDSLFMPPDQSLPEAAEVTLALFRKPRPAEALEADGDGDVPGMIHVRRVSLVMRPIDVTALLELGGDSSELDCFTISQCLKEGDDDWYQEELTDDCGGDQDLCDLLRNPGDGCWSSVQSSYPGVAARAPRSCES
jgi:hypothetical protein